MDFGEHYAISLMYLSLTVGEYSNQILESLLLKNPLAGGAAVPKDRYFGQQC